MIRIITTRRLRQAETAAARAQERAVLAEERLERSAARAVSDLEASARRARRAEARTALAAFDAEVAAAGAERCQSEYGQLLALAALALTGADHRARAAEKSAERFSTELNRLAGAVHLATERPTPVFIVLRDGRVHGVHATEHSAYKQAESDPEYPVAPGGWGEWSPGVDSPTESRWRVLKTSVHGLFEAVQAEAAAVHATAAGFHDAEGSGGRDG
ncbi:MULTISPECIES: hypothetical protein [unclassified Streptomyces]|uniref:hypothetical protein n=1 Tax=unclassified Streptomyces TaxID=2593676 RepID=UPI000CD4F00E|nr:MULTISPECIES: hypothetical protein [unclassified Streptomyces]